MFIINNIITSYNNDATLRSMADLWIITEKDYNSMTSLTKTKDRTYDSV